MAQLCRCVCFWFAFNVVILPTSYSPSEAQHQKELYQHGDVIIGGLFPIHLQQINEKCVGLRPEALVWSEAMKLSIQEINSNPSFLPNIALGYDIQDTCGTEQVAISSAAQFSFVNSLMFNERYKQAVNSCVDFSSKNNNTRPPIIAVLGGEDSRVSVNMANVLQLGDIAQISYGATSRKLSNKDSFRTFFRTVPSDEFQSQAMAQIVRENKWTCVAVIGTDDVYGRSGITSFQDSAKDQDICIALLELFPVYDSGNRIDKLVKKLKSMKHVEIIILYSLSAQAVRVFKEAVKQNMIDKTWIASDGWAESAYIRQREFIPIIQGTIGFEFRDVHYEKLERHLQSINSTSHVSEWWDEFWSSEFNCSAKNLVNSNLKPCDGREKITSDLYTKKLHSPMSAYVVDAVYAVANALHIAQNCAGLKCNNLSSITPEKIVEALRRTSFTGLTGSFNFSQQEKQARYDIVNLQVNSAGGLEAVNIGQWDNKQLEINNSAIQWHNDKRPRSSCGAICPKGTYQGKTIQCVWGCYLCSEDTYTDVEGSTYCKKCPKAFVHEKNYTSCKEVPPQYIHWSDPWGIGLIIANFVGIIMTLVVIGLIIKNYSTPIVIETGGFLNLALLFDILLSYGFNFILLSKPSDFRCDFLAAWFYTVYPGCIVIFLLKILFIRRCFKKSDTINVQGSQQALASELRPMWQYYIAAIAAVVFPVAMSIMWITLGDLQSSKVVITRDIIYMTCSSLDSAGGKALRYFIVVYLFLMTVATTVYSHKTRQVCQSQKFREAKHMFYALAVFLVTLTTFYPGWALIQGPVLQVFACTTNITAATGVIVCTYGPKVHLLLLYPVLNTYEHVHPVHTSVTSAAMHMGLHLVTTARGRTVTVLEDSNTTPQSSPQRGRKDDTCISNNGSTQSKLEAAHSNEISDS